MSNLLHHLHLIHHHQRDDQMLLIQRPSLFHQRKAQLHHQEFQALPNIFIGSKHVQNPDQNLNQFLLHLVLVTLRLITLIQRVKKMGQVKEEEKVCREVEKNCEAGWRHGVRRQRRCGFKKK
ncbi:hypothetical protein GBA52_027802 [Prunus armeniaca]|nr:hypothetical protein GBA52_027802 [Prunus armeniaca]